MLEGTHVNGDFLSGIILLRDCSVGLTKNGKYYYYGTLTSGVDINFKVWDNSEAYRVLRDNQLGGKVVEITATWNEYNGSYSLLLNSIKEVTNVPVDNFMPCKYNIEVYYSTLHKLIETTVSPKALEIAEDVLFNNDKVAEMFKLEFAAKSHHDNCKGGLLAHTYKVCSLLANTLRTYTDLARTQSDVDLLMLGGLFHDLGKIREMHFGQYQVESCVTHRFLGVEMLNKSKIVEAYNEEWYYNLISIMLQHHGEYGDPCRTVVAYVVHLIDVFDANMTLLAQKLGDEQAHMTGNVRIDNNVLSILSEREVVEDA